MNDKKNKPDLDELGIVVDDLPPLDGDAVDEADPEVLAGYLSELEESESFLAEQDEPRSPGDEDEIRSELAHLEQESWADDGAEADKVEFELEVEEEETGWSDAGADEVLDLHDDWFVGQSDESMVDDGGEEGPVDDEIASIDASSWDDLGDDIEEDDLEPVEEVMDRLGIAFPEAEREERERSSVPRVDRGVVLDRQFLGPIDGLVEAVAVSGGAVIAVGDGVFVLGADGMLHRAPDRLSGQGNSICVHGEFTLVGTDTAGAFRLGSRDRQATAINSWNAVWVGEKQLAGRVTTSIRVSGQPIDDGFRLLGLTGEGQLFASLDLGRTWVGPLSAGKCISVVPLEGAKEVVALIAGAKTPPSLVVSADLRQWREIPTPPALGAAARAGTVRLAASEQTILAAAEDPTAPLLCSLDRGESWSEISTLGGVTALAVDPGDPGWIAAATHDPDRDLGLVRVSQDGGKIWRTAAITGRERSRRGRGAAAEVHGMVTLLLVDVGRHRRLFAVAGEGVHQIVLASGGLSH
jgi:hypothetical protein